MPTKEEMQEMEVKESIEQAALNLKRALPGSGAAVFGALAGRDMTPEEKEAYTAKFKRLQECRTLILKKYPDLVVSINSYGNRLTLELSAYPFL